MHELEEKGASLRVLEPAIDTGGPMGRMVLTVLGMVAEMELGFIRDRRRARIDAAKAKGIYKGRIAFRKKIYGSIADLQVDLDRWVQSYNEERPHQGRWCFGKTPMQTFLDATPLAKEKMIAA